MLTRRRLLIGLLIAMAPIAPVVCWTVWRAISLPRPIRAYERIRLGMTPAEVERAIGMPPGEFAPLTASMSRGYPQYIRESGLPSETADAEWVHAKVTVQRWRWEEYAIYVAFDEEQKAVGYYLLRWPDAGAPPSFFDRLREFVGL
jgi:hypothetical protein